MSMPIPQTRQFNHFAGVVGKLAVVAMQDQAFNNDPICIASIFSLLAHLESGELKTIEQLSIVFCKLHEALGEPAAWGNNNAEANIVRGVYQARNQFTTNLPKSTS